MRPVIAKSIVVPDIKRVCIIREVVTRVEGMLRHLPPFVIGFVEKEGFLGMVVDDILGGGELRGRAEERLESPSVLHELSIQSPVGAHSRYRKPPERCETTTVLMPIVSVL